jgi:uncharacterized protein YhbP (UPF0306 family)
MTKEELFCFIARQDLAVLATNSPSNAPQAALMGIAVTPELELIFDTVKSSRKYPNLIANPRVALVIGWNNEITVQYEGQASELQGEELKRCKEIYFQKWKDGPVREKWPGIVYFVVRPKWIRYCDYNPGTRNTVEMTF